METKEIVNEKKLLLNQFIDTASKKDLEEVLEFIAYLKRNLSIEERNGRGIGGEQEELEELRALQLDTGVEVQGILNSFNDLELSEIENKISSKLQKENTSKEAFDIFEQKLPIDNFIETASRKDLQAVLDYIAILKRNIGVEERQASGSEEELEESGLYIDDKFDVQGCLYGLNDSELGKIENKIHIMLQKDTISRTPHGHDSEGPYTIDGGEKVYEEA